MSHIHTPQRGEEKPALCSGLIPGSGQFVIGSDGGRCLTLFSEGPFPPLGILGRYNSILIVEKFVWLWKLLICT
jgi:hypothetical protein